MKFLLTFLLTFGTSFGIQAQHTSSEVDNIEATIQELFDAYRAGDSARVAATFTKDATLQSLKKDEEGEVFLTEAIPAQVFVDYIGDGLSTVHDERLWDTQVFYDDFLATVWTKYALYLGNKFHHCGTETFHLRKVDGDWKIFYLVDTRQLEDCQIPANIK